MRRVGLFLAIAALGIVAALVGIRSTGVPKRATAATEETERPEARPGADAAAGGRVVDLDTGEPVPGARLTLYRASLDLPVAQVVATFVANDLGRFSVADHAEQQLIVEAAGYPPQACWFDPTAVEIGLSLGQDRTLRIVDDEGRPAAGGEVDVFVDGRMRIRLASAEADADGVVTLRLTGDEALLVRFPGYAYEALANKDTEVVLVPEYTIGGRIENTAGRPIEGASVGLRQGKYAPAVLTRREGRFHFRGVHGCECEMTVRAEGYCEAHRSASPGDEDLRVVLRRSASASGIVVMPDGSPAQLAVVNIDGRDDGGVGTDEQGRFTLTGLQPRAQEIVATLQGLRATLEIEPAEGEGLTGLRLGLGAPQELSSVVRVQVVDERGRAVPGATVAAHNGRGTTDRDGVASLNTGAPPGFRTKIVINPPPEEPRRLIGTAVTVVTSAWSDARVLDVVLHDAMLVPVDVRGPDGSRPEDVSVELFRTGSSGLPLANPIAAEEGWYVDPEDTYAIHIDAPDFVFVHLRRWSPRDAGGVIAATLRPRAAVRGRAVDSTGAPLAEVHATVDFHLDRMGMGRKLTCERDGTFLLEGLEEGAGTLTLGQGRGAPEAAAKLTTVSGRTTDIGDLMLVAPIVLTGKVVDSAAQPLGGTRVWMETGLPDAGWGTYSRADGTFRIVAPGFGSAHLRAEKRGYGTVRSAIPAGPARAIGGIAMPAPGSLQVEVEGEWGEAEYLDINIAWEADASAGSRTCWRGDEQPYCIDDVAPGRYLVRLNAGDLTMQEEVQVVAKATAKVVFRLGR